MDTNSLNCLLRVFLQSLILGVLLAWVFFTFLLVNYTNWASQSIEIRLGSLAAPGVAFRVNWRQSDELAAATALDPSIGGDNHFRFSCLFSLSMASHERVLNKTWKVRANLPERPTSWSLVELRTMNAHVVVA